MIRLHKAHPAFWVVVWAWLGMAAARVWAGEQAKPLLSLTLIPPAPVTDQISLEIRAAAWNHGQAGETFDITCYLDREAADNALHRWRIQIAPQCAAAVSFRWPTRGRAGSHRIIVTATSTGPTRRSERPMKIIASDVRSTGRIGGAWVDIYHFSEAEGKYFNRELAKMTGDDWRELVRAMHDIGMNVLVNTMLFQNYTHYGAHHMDEEGYTGKAFYPSRRFPGRMPIACEDALEAILSEADKHGMHVFPGIGPYAFFDYTPAALAWHKEVAEEVWHRYGHHPSFYGWYVSDEIPGDLGNDPARWRQIVAFFRAFRAHCRRFAPDKPVMLASNAHFVPRAADAYRRLLPHLDILCPFGFHRMPRGDISGAQAARRLQQLCDEAGCHLWMDLETFVFHPGMALYPRQVVGLISDLRRFPDFEKTLCYQYPGLLAAPWASRKPGGPPSVALYQDYRRYLEEGMLKRDVQHAALDKRVELAYPYALTYSGSGDRALVDGLVASPHYRDASWQGFYQNDLLATIDLGAPTPVKTLATSFLQETAPGIFLPARVEYAISDDGRDFRTVTRVKHAIPLQQPGPLVHQFRAALDGAPVRYVRVRARNIKTIPAWHRAAGGKAWLFADEIRVNAR